MVLFMIGYFGADSLITVLLTSGFGVSLGQAAIVLSAVPPGWALNRLAAPRFTSIRLATMGLGLTALGTAVLAFGGSFTTALTAWTRYRGHHRGMRRPTAGPRHRRRIELYQHRPTRLVRVVRRDRHDSNEGSCVDLRT